jgi:hypothetical protein
MAEQLPKRFLPNRHAHDIAKRVFETLAFEPQFNPSPDKNDLWIPDTFYQIDTIDRSASIAELVVRRPLERDMLRGGILPDSIERKGLFEMGYYDPARQQWIVYDDVASPEDQIVLEQHFEQLALIERELLEVESSYEAGSIFYDFRHHATQEARKKTRAFLTHSGLFTGLITHNPQNEIRNKFIVDQKSAAYISLVTRNIGDQTEDVLQVNYRGLVRPAISDIERLSLVLPVAKRMEGGDWTPNKPLMRQEHWEDYLRLAAEFLESHRMQYPKFSMARCAIVNTGTPLTAK